MELAELEAAVHAADEVHSAQVVVVAAGSLEDELHSAQVVAAADSVGLTVRVEYNVAVTDEGASGAPDYLLATIDSNP